jgi:N-acetylmuramic acid 6-phosphate etherase
MLSTGAMVRIGKTYGNLMVDLRATNNKLRDRSRRIVESLTGLSAAASLELLERCNGEVKTAIVVYRRSTTPAQARQLLAQSNGRVRVALEDHEPKTADRPANAIGDSPTTGREQ